MTAIYLIRHGQASFAEQDYDKLSPKGIEQAKILGQHWQTLARHKANSGENVHYYCGSLLRHEQTAEHFFNGLLRQELKQNITINQLDKGVITHAGFNELDHVDVLSRYNKNWRSFQGMSTSIKQTQSMANNSQDYHLLPQEFSQAMKRWIGGEFDGEYQESWSQFKQRSIRSFQEVVTQVNTSHVLAKSPKNNELLVFTSGGVIGVILAHILQLSDQQSLQISQQLVNSSVSKIIATKDGFRLGYFNNYSHLELAGKEWLSYV